MENIKKVSLVPIVAMAIISFISVFGINIGGLSVIIGVIFFFINKASEKQTFKDSGFDIGDIRTNLEDKTIWFWICLPLIVDIASITISRLFWPQYIEHVLARTEGFLSFNKIILLIFQLAVLAIGEEIAWRAFFQNQLSKTLPIIPALLITSALFALGHLAEGNIFIVIYDIFFIFINSILYGIIFHKSNNVWISAIAHFIANVFGIIILLFF